MEAAAANVIGAAVTDYVRRRHPRSGAYAARKRIKSKHWAVPKNPNPVYRFIRTVSTGQSGATIYMGTNASNSIVFKCAGATSQTMQMSFSLSTFTIYLGGVSVLNVVVPSYTEFAALFDKYRIDKVDVYYTSSWDSNNGSGGVQLFYGPAVAYTVDTDDAGASTASDIMQYSTCKYTQFSNQRSRNFLCSFRPQANLPAYVGTSATAGSASAPKDMWLDLGTPAIDHYGVKFAIDQLVTTTQANVDWTQIQFQCVYHLAMKDVR